LPTLRIRPKVGKTCPPYLLARWISGFRSACSYCMVSGEFWGGRTAVPALIHLYGPFGVTAEDGSTLDVSLRGAAILAVLAMAGDAGVGRERLAGLIWCDRGEAQARASLRQELSTLRRLVPAVCADRQRVWLDLGLIQVAQPEGAAEFLDGFALRSGAFDDWLRDTRLRDRGTRVGAATEAAQAALAAGNWSAAREAAQDALAIDPLGEAAARVLIRAEAQLGNRSAALTAFQRLEDALRAELDVAPDAQTRALVREVRREVHPTTKPQGARSADRRPVLAVLPFEALGTAGSDVLADGLVEEITGALSRTDAFDVIARQSAFALGESARDAHAAAAQLGADYLVEGTFQRAGNRLRLSVQLVAGESGLTHWSERFDDELDDLFDVQDRVAAQVAGHLAPHLRSAEIARAHRTPKADRNAYDQVLSALPHFWAHRREENAMAIWHLEAALAEKPKHPLALGYMAWASAQLCTYQWSSDIDRDRADAMDYITRGGLVAGDSPAVLTALAAALSLLNEDFPLARRYVDRALALDPNGRV